MRIESLNLSPGINFVNPTIKIEGQINHVDEIEAITGISGWLKTEEDVYLSPISEVAVVDQRKDDIRAKGTYRDKSRSTSNYYFVFAVQLNEKTLKFLENERTKNHKKDVRIKIELNVAYVENMASVSHVFTLEPAHFKLPYAHISDSSGRQVAFKILSYAYDREYSSDPNNLWILSGDNGPTYLSIRNQKMTQNITIPSSDWINDYAPNFGLGNFTVIEIPTGSEIISDAWAYVKKADTAYMNWDSKSVYANCRECGSLLDNKMKEKFGNQSYSYKERWGRNYNRFSHMCSLDLHLEEKIKSYPDEQVEIKKPDAEHLIISTKALVNLAQELLYA